MPAPRALKPSLPLKALAFGWLGVWCLVAAFPIFWITVMSVKHPVDAFSSNPFIVIFGDFTRETAVGISPFGGALAIGAIWAAYRVAVKSVPAWAAGIAPRCGHLVAWIVSALAYLLGVLVAAVLILPPWLALPTPGLVRLDDRLSDLLPTTTFPSGYTENSTAIS